MKQRNYVQSFNLKCQLDLQLEKIHYNNFITGELSYENNKRKI